MQKGNFILGKVTNITGVLRKNGFEGIFITKKHF